MVNECGVSGGSWKAGGKGCRRAPKDGYGNAGKGIATNLAKA